MRRLKKKYRRALWAIIAVTVVAIVAPKACRSCRSVVVEKADTVPQLRLNDTLTNALSDCADIHDMDSLIKRYLKRWELNGAQLAIARNDSLLYAKGFGWANKELGIAMEPNMIMRMASVSKLVTAIGVMKLQEMGRLRLSDKVFGPKGILNDTAYTNVIKDKRYYDITVEHLLRHQGGFTNAAGDPMFSTRYIMMQNHLKEPPNHRTLLRILLRRRLGYNPGTMQRYSNLGYTLLSMIIERRSGMAYETFMQKKVLEPAGCYDFHIAGIYYEDRRDNEVKYYMHQGSEPVYEYNNSGRKVDKCYGENDLPRLSGAGAWCASAAELCRLIASVDGIDRIPDILNSKSVAAMTREMPNHGFSIGWNFTPNRRPWVRTGSLSGTSAIVLRYPDGECWVLITNTSTWKGHGFSHDTMAFFEKLRKKFGAKMPRRDLFFADSRP